MKKIKKKYKIKFKNIVMFFVCLICFLIGNSLFYKIKLYSSNEEFIMNLLDNSNMYKTYEKKNYLKKIADGIFKIDLEKPTTLLKNMISHDIEDNYNPNVLGTISKHIKDPNPTKDENPIVYIYNSHQLENYSNSNYEDYNITPNVMMASYLLKEKLNEKGISTLVEEANFTEFIKINNWDYNYSYLASRYYIEEALKKYKTIKYTIDLHRDSINKESSSTVINGKEYAKVLFVVGMEHQNHQANLNLTTKINEEINKNYPSLSRGIIKKSGPNVNGIYNQDLTPNSILIEMGGYQNKIEEVYNTIEIISQILKEIINENKDI
ncbi:MAG: stage II sporulation protein P [Bacilli bacterium]